MNHTNETHGQGGASHGNKKEYVTGLIASIVLTIIPFAIVMGDLASNMVTIIVVVACAIAQLYVQLVYFLHMNASSEQSWNTMTGVYSLVIAIILIIGSMWIFDHLHHNMLMGH